MFQNNKENKVLICIPCLLTGGTEIQTLSLVKALVGGGHKVTTVCYFEFSELMVQNYINSGSKVVCLQKDGLRIGGKAIFSFLYKGLKKVIRDMNPDVVHVQYMAPGAIPILVLKLIGVKNIIATAHTAADIYPNLRLIHFIQKYLVRAFTCITLKAEQSFFQSSKLFDCNTIIKKRNHFTIYNTLPDYIKISTSPKCFNSDVLTLGVVSRLEKIKGMDLIIPVFAKLYEIHQNIRLLIVGDGSLRYEMEQQTMELGVNGAVEWKGRTEQSKLQMCYDNIDILLMPSRSEGFGLTAIEGMARGCIPVVADIGGLPEVVENGVSGLLHKPEDIEDIVRQIEWLIFDLNRMSKISENAIKRSQVFNKERFGILINNLYSKL